MRDTYCDGSAVAEDEGTAFRGKRGRPDRRRVGIFFLLAFGISWGVWVPAAMHSHGLITFSLPSALAGLAGSFGPFIAAVLVAVVWDGSGGLRRLFGPLLQWRVGIRWYLFVLLWPVAHSLAVTAIAMALGSAAPDFAHPPFVEAVNVPPEVAAASPFVFVPLVLLQQTLIGSSMGEEIGWRGYALPGLQAGGSALRASLLLGLAWGLWHLPLWLTEGHPTSGPSVGWLILGLMGTGVLFTWIYNSTGGSLLPALLFHSSIAVTGLFLASAPAHPLIGVALTWALAGALIWRLGPEDLSRKERVANVPVSRPNKEGE